MSNAPPIERYRQANATLNQGLIRPDSVRVHSPRSARDWMAEFLADIGHPQRGLPALHIAATSGKGSIAVIAAEILRAAGVYVGLHTSPYLQVATEKLWVDGSYASADEFANLVDEMRPVVKRWRRPDTPLHGMASFGIALLHLRRKQVDAAIIEVGVGGRDDLTRVMETDVAVVGSIGFDHMATLGTTLAQIAWHKAGIICSGCKAIALAGVGAEAAAAQARAVGAALRTVQPTEIAYTQDDAGQGTLSYNGPRVTLSDVPLGMRGRFQAQNALLAIAAVEAWAERHPPLTLSAAAVSRGLARARLPGRLELISANVAMAGGTSLPCPVLLDGAHNQDKLDGLAEYLRHIRHRRLIVVYGQLATKAAAVRPDALSALAHTVVLCEPPVYAKPAAPAAQLAHPFRCHRHLRVWIEPNAELALKLAASDAHPTDLIVVTGSLYLVGQLRALWFPDEEVLRQQGSWLSAVPTSSG